MITSVTNGDLNYIMSLIIAAVTLLLFIMFAVELRRSQKWSGPFVYLGMAIIMALVAMKVDKPSSKGVTLHLDPNMALIVVLVGVALVVIGALAYVVKKPRRVKRQSQPTIG